MRISPRISEKKFERPQWYTGYSGAWGKLIHEKNLTSKISWHCPFNVTSFIIVEIFLPWRSVFSFSQFLRFGLELKSFSVFRKLILLKQFRREQNIFRVESESYFLHYTRTVWNVLWDSCLVQKHLSPPPSLSLLKMFFISVFFSYHKFI